MRWDWVWKICKCDKGIGESCDSCYSPAGTKPCLFRYCEDCSIEGCSVRVREKENEQELS